MLVVTGLTFSLSLLASGGPALRTGPGEGERTHYTSLSTPLAGQGQLAGCQALQGEAAAAHTPDIPASPHHSLPAPAQSYILPGAYELPKAARSVQLRIIAQNGVCIYSST